MDSKRNENSSNAIDSAIAYYENKNTQFILERFRRQVLEYFELNPILCEGTLPAVHSLKSRMKDPAHLKDKLQRKMEKGIVVTDENLFSEVTDLIGVRVMYLHQEQFPIIHREIMNQVSKGEWKLKEPAKAYTWDPDSQKFFEEMDIKTEVKDSYYTSVHYVIKPNNNEEFCCEIQVRTLFEEIWGEIDHAINYPYETESIACREQLRVLSKLVSMGTRLSDSIFRSYGEFKQYTK